MYRDHPLFFVLPMELRNMIYLDLSRHDMVQLLKTCRTLFNLTRPFVWRKADVELAILLRMLPGCQELPPVDGGLDINIPEQLPDDYFDRVRLYAPYVETLRLCLNYNISGASVEEPSLSTLLRRVSLNPLAPRLKSLKLLIPDSVDLALSRGYRHWLQVFDSAGSIRSLTTQSLCLDNAQVFHPSLPYKCNSGSPGENAHSTLPKAAFPLNILPDLHPMPLCNLKIHLTVTPHSGRSTYKNISGLWPNLRFLCIRSPVEIQELFAVRDRFPRLTKLHTQPFSTYSGGLELRRANDTIIAKSPSDMTLRSLTLDFVTYQDGPDNSSDRCRYSREDLNLAAQYVSFLFGQPL